LETSGGRSVSKIGLTLKDRYVYFGSKAAIAAAQALSQVDLNDRTNLAAVGIDSILLQGHGWR
jgi:hypothetical protein